jgi:putative transposase
MPTIHRTWGLRGQTPLLRHRLRHYGKVSAIGAVSLSPRQRRAGMYLLLVNGGNVAQETVRAFLRDLMRHLRGRVILVWDRWSVHRGRLVQAYLARQRRLRVEWLPPYAPDLNPVEHAWGHMKYHDLANHGLEDVATLAEAVAEDYRRLRGQPRLLRGFVRATQLPIRL